MDFCKLVSRGLIAAALVSLIACGKAPEEETDPLHPGGVNTQDKTNRDDCDVKNSPGTSSIYQSRWWVYSMTHKNVFVQESLKFDSGSLTKTVICTLGTNSATATVRVNAGIDDRGREFTILSNGHQEQTLAFGGTSYNCVADLQPTTESRKFKFQGKCMGIQATSTDELVYVPEP